MSERSLLNKLMVRASEMGARLFRNNSGAFEEDGRWIKFGVANPGGSDLLGWRSVIVTPQMVGKKVAIFMAVEGKIGRTKVTENQQAFIDTVNEAGGIGIIVRSDDGENFKIEYGGGL